MGLFNRKKTIRLNPDLPKDFSDKRSQIPDDAFKRCPNCRQVLFRKLVPADYTCPKCSYHLNFPAPERLFWLLDEGAFTQWDGDLMACNPLDFPDYDRKLQGARALTGLREAVITGQGQLDGQDLAIAIMDSRFIMASMGTVVGEKLTRLFERARELKLPVLIYACSGGARMQEGILSLMQMAKVTQAVSRHSQAGLLYISFLTHPTTGGVTASFANQADIILAEPQATVGFAGKRVIQQTLNSRLPDNFQTAERVLEVGFIDKIVARKDQHSLLSFLIQAHSTKEVANESLSNRSKG
ncbi:acetyl-CoA carboxylase carboxyltransferase subunit beta [Hutsoniella sourekii]|uniref:acetyl-CoA carboxylase carboxyltransferase subunit beta n=1 Tax=Hutsoniella sourekii TaxID=87650 RepID=UPI000484A743|nr:acetyl-CoA carboxylase carboxyltransferase subunit beta [Hutsoniella sourekii]